MYLTWGLVLVVLLVVAGIAGKASSSGHIFGILIDSRNRYSLNQLQLTGWTFLVLTSFVTLFFRSFPDPTIPEIPQTLLALLGISVSTSVFSGGIKANKDAATKVNLAKVITAKAPKLIQVILEEEGKAGEQERVSVTKFQNLIFTFVLWVFFVVLFFKSDPAALPTFPETAIWLIGISHSGYVAAKVPNQV